MVSSPASKPSSRSPASAEVPALTQRADLLAAQIVVLRARITALEDTVNGAIRIQTNMERVPGLTDKVAELQKKGGRRVRTR